MAADIDQNRRDAQELGLLRGKGLEIHLSQANNEPLLTLTHIEQLTKSLIQALKTGSKKVSNPNPAVLKIMAGEQTVTDYDLRFDLAGIKTEDLGRNNALNYLEKTLYPEDVVNIIANSRAWIVSQYKENLTYGWQISAQSLQAQWQTALEARRAGGIYNPVASFSQTNLKDALEELATVAAIIIGRYAKPEELDEIEDVLQQISGQLDSNRADTIVEVWTQTVKKVLLALRTADLGDNFILVLDKKVSLPNIRRLIDEFNQQVFDRLNKQIKPWTNLTPAHKAKFEAQKGKVAYGSISLTDESVVHGADLDVTTAGLSYYEQFFSQLTTEPKKEEEKDKKEEAEEDEDSEAGEPDEQPPQKLTQEEIINEIFNQLPPAMWHPSAVYLSQHYDLNKLSEQQLEQLQDKIEAQVVTLVARSSNREQSSYRGQLVTQIKHLIAPYYDPEGDQYVINADQQQQVLTQVAQSLVSLMESELRRIYDEVAAAADEEPEEPEKPKEQPDETQAEVELPAAAATPTTTPDLGAAADTAIVPPVEELATDTLTAVSPDEAKKQRAKFIEQTTIGFLALYFEFERNGYDLSQIDELQDYVRRFLIKKLATFTPDQLNSNLRFKLYRQLQLDAGFYELSLRFYEAQLEKLGLADIKHRANIENTVDSIICLVDDPQRFINNLSHDELLAYLGLTDKIGVDISELKKLLLHLVSLRRSHYQVSYSQIHITPWFVGEKGRRQFQQDHQRYLPPLRDMVGKAGEDGVLSLNATEKSIEQSDLSDWRQTILKQLRRQTWKAMVADLPEEEVRIIYATYKFYQYEQAPLPRNLQVPDLFYISDFIERVNRRQFSIGDHLPNRYQTPEGREKLAKKLVDKTAQAIGKTALSLAGPEVTAALEALEKIPIIGKQVKKAEEKIGKLLALAAAAAAALITGLIALLKEAAIVILSTIIGGVLGTIFIPIPVFGTIAGLGGGFTAGKILTGDGVWLKNAFNWTRNQLGFGSQLGQAPQSGLGVQASLAPEAGLGAEASTGAKIGAKLAGLGKVAGQVMVGGTLAMGGLHQLNMAQISNLELKPVGTENLPDLIIEVEQSKYVEVTKKASVTKLEINEATTITYTINILPKGGYTIVPNLDNISDTFSYVGGDALNLPNQTQAIKQLLGETPLTGPKQISYEVEVGSPHDVAVNNKFEFSFTTTSGENDNVSAFNSVIVGEPDINCITMAGPEAENDSISQALPWKPNLWNKVMNLFMEYSGKISSLKGLMCANGPIYLYMIPTDGDLGGYSFGSNKIGLTMKAFGWSDIELIYVLMHELGHVVHNIYPGILDGLWTNVPAASNNCFGYPAGACSPYEAFAEGFARSIVNHPYRPIGSTGYDWFMKNVFKEIW